MAETKDKVITVESLLALHEHNKETYMSKINPAGTGTLSINRKEGSISGDYSSAIGFETTASGIYSHAEGYGTIASGAYSHAEGINTTASGVINSHAEGYNTIASGSQSHAEGYGTIASGASQHVQGKYNIEDNTNKYAHIVGNGEFNAQSNAHTLDWDGNSWFAGDVYVGGTSQDNGVKLVKSTNVVSIEYGDTLPEAGNVGRIFFKKLSE